MWECSQSIAQKGVRAIDARNSQLEIRRQKINANFLCTNFFNNPSGHGHPPRKSWTSAPKTVFSCGPGGGEKLFDPGASRRKGQERPREIRTKKFMFILFFLPWEMAQVQQKPVFALPGCRRMSVNILLADLAFLRRMPNSAGREEPISRTTTLQKCGIRYFACSPESFGGFLFSFAWEFCIEKRQGFLVNFFWSPFPTKTRQKSRGKFRAQFGGNFRTKIRKIRETFVLQRFWPKNPCNFRDRHLRKITKHFCLRQKNQSQLCIPRKPKKHRCLGIRCWDPNLSSGYQNCGLGIHRWEFLQNRSGRNSEFLSKVSGVPLRWGSLRCKSKFWARNFKFWARDVHPTISQAQVKTLLGAKNQFA